MENRTTTEDERLEHISRLIRNTPVEVELVDRTMKRFEAKGRNNRAPRRRKVAVLLASVMLLILSLLGAGFISPTLAASIGQIPVLGSIFELAGDLGLRTANEKGLALTPDRSDSHEGLTLNVPEVLFDGVRVSIGLERRTTEERFLKRELGDLLGDIKVSINGEDLRAYGLKYGGSSPGVFILKGKDDASRIVQFSDMRGQGGRALPDKFELLLTVHMDGILDPFHITLPVEKKTANNLIAQPVTREHAGMIFTLDKVELTPITSLITTRIELPEGQRISEKLPSMGFELADDKGNLVRAVNEGVGFSATGGNVLTTDTLFEPLQQPVKQVTIRTYKILSIDSEGYVDKEYIPEFEVVVPVK
ncbi:DUF4179 domain-containing protein [Paenibacillus sp. HW567]|uniref:DUF4179 domain-containing protein n=1 Tax=Paenibacillus sp. HW567 TaxID=1034769 RepID=UPI00036B9C21|nr:DUF4179 domain-containing protein [Paenibacillus sp. HW567]